MNCCDYDCHQGKNCPVRRVRAGTCANGRDDEQLWLQYSDEQLEKWRRESNRADRLAALFIASCIGSFFLLVWLTT